MRRLLLPIVLLAFALPALAARFDNAFVPRLLLEKGGVSRQYEVERFNNATDACNFYGAQQTLCTLATEFFSDVTGNVGKLFMVTRFPSESTRSHLYGGGAVALQSTAALVSALDAGTTLYIHMNGWTIPGCFKTGGGTINGITCVDLSTKNITTNSQLALQIQNELNANQVSFGTVTASISNVSFAATNYLQASSVVVANISATSGIIYPGGFFCAAEHKFHCRYFSSDQVGEIENPSLWAGGTGTGVGIYSWFAPPPSQYQGVTTVGVYSYGILSVTAQLTGAPITTPMAVDDGRVNVLPSTYLWQCIANCPPAVPSSKAPQQWIVTNAKSVSSETMTEVSGTNGVTSTAALIQFDWNDRVGPTATWGYFEVQQSGMVNPFIPVGGLVPTADGSADGGPDTDTIDCATGTAAPILGLDCGSPGYPRVPYSHAFVSSPGDTITDVGNWLNTFRAAHPSLPFKSCEVVGDPPGGGPNNVSTYVQAWAATASPPVHCPLSWLTTPPSTPPLLWPLQ